MVSSSNSNPASDQHFTKKLVHSDTKIMHFKNFANCIPKRGLPKNLENNIKTNDFEKSSRMSEISRILIRPAKPGHNQLFQKIG